MLALPKFHPAAFPCNPAFGSLSVSAYHKSGAGLKEDAIVLPVHPHYIHPLPHFITRHHTAYQNSGRIPPPTDSRLDIMSVLNPKRSSSTRPSHSPSRLFAPSSPLPISLAPDMSDEPGVEYMGARSKVRSPFLATAGRHRKDISTDMALSLHQRTRRLMSEDSMDERQTPWGRHLPHPRTGRSRPGRLPPTRHPRDGFDFRRPATITPQEANVIDLTNEPETPPQGASQNETSNSRTSSISRPPRFGRNILTDVVDLEDEPDNDPGEGPSSSPEVQFVRSNTIYATPQQRGWNPIPSVSNGHNLLRSLSSLSSSLAQFRRLPVPDAFIYLTAEELNGTVSLDYEQPSFAMESPSAPESRSQRDTYKAPSPAPEGFTRTLGEDDAAVCPNCYWELGTGEGQKQEIWVAKPCGHVRSSSWQDVLYTQADSLQVYCGECAGNRSLSKAKKSQGPQRTKPFSKCQVADCGKQVSAPTAMIHLFL